MIEAFLVISGDTLLGVTDAMDVYEGSIPPTATFQTVDADNSTTTNSAPQGDTNAN